MEFSLNYFAEKAQGAIDGVKYPATAPRLYEPIKYGLEAGGKRLRPALCMAVYSALSGKDAAVVASQAAAVEMFHNFTLLHDDVMDKADVRRGKPTVHRVWGENAAILSGDAMLTMAYDLLEENSGDKFHELFKVFSTTAMEVYQGQQLDMEFETRSDVSVSEYLQMIKLKTSVLLACACRLGAICADASAEVAEKFYQYGLALGLAFQLRDDWLDTFGDPDVFGKKIGGDILNQKKTWLLINALSLEKDETEAILAEDLEDDEKIRQVSAVYRRLKLDKACQDIALKYADEARAHLQGINISAEAFIFFNNLAIDAANRQK